MTIKVALSAIWYPMAMATYFWRALSRRKDVELCVVGPFTGTWIPWNGGMHLAQKYVKTPDIPLPGEALRMHVRPELIMNALPWTPDIWIQVDAGWHFYDRPPGRIVAHVQTDPHVLKGTYQRPMEYSDLNFCMQRVYIQDPTKEIYLPYAYDPTVHYPMPEIMKTYDACLIGLHYETRDYLTNSLMTAGYKVRYGIGDIFDEYRLAYNQSRVALSWSSMWDIPTRVFEAMAMGLPLVCNHVPDLPMFFEDEKHYLGFDDNTEAFNQVRRLLEDDELRLRIADQGWKQVQPHTWDARVEQILKEAKLIEESNYVQGTPTNQSL